MKVRVKQTNREGWFGFYDGKRRYPGDEFEINNENELGTWMEKAGVEEEKPRRRSRLQLDAGEHEQNSGE